MKLSLLLLLFSLCLYSIGTFMANQGLFPLWLIDHVWFDEVGHFFIFGVLAFTLALFCKQWTKLWLVAYPIVILFQLLDESLQLLSLERTFSFSDIVFSILGIIVFGCVHVVVSSPELTRTLMRELVVFAKLQAAASIFGALLLFFILFTTYVDLPGLYRYDYIFLFAITVQILLIVFKLETTKELVAIFSFHIVATVMELFKTSSTIQSWNYPEDAIFIVATVPLFTGFLYSAVGSYIARAWKLLSLSFSNYPKFGYTYILAAGIYINFFTHHFIFDFRYLLICFAFVLFWNTKVYFRLTKEYSMPLLLGFILISFFIWIAENIGTFTGTWFYPNQEIVWTLVSPQKCIAWFLLMIISFVLVSVLYRKELRERSHL